MFDLYSHDQPKQTLYQHLLGVLEMATANLKHCKAVGWSHDGLLKAVSIIAVFHDFAKATSYFQEYITSENKRKSQQSSHALLSAIISYYVGKEVLQGEEEEVRLSSLFIFMAVRKHHGNIEEFKSEINGIQDKKNLLLQQAKAIRYKEWNDIITAIAHLLPFSLERIAPFTQELVEFWVNQFYIELPDLRRWLRERYDLRNKNIGMKDYFSYCTLYSLLLDGDKNQAALREMILYGRKTIEPTVVNQFKNTKKWAPSPMNQLREQAYAEVETNIMRLQGNLFSINLPTGMGKTITSFNAALKLRERRKKERGIEPRIIYSLPFLSVIDQNYEVFEKILQSTQGNIDYTYMIKHHSLVDPYEQINKSKKENEDQWEYDFDQAKVLVEGWNSEIICTTFAQVFQTLISNRNRALRKFHRFSNAILVLDEIQAIPVKYWELMRAMILELVNGMDTDVILLTATEPKIFLEEDRVQPLCNRESYFLRMDRISIVPCIKEKQTIHQFVETLELDPKMTYLFILNTIESAKMLHTLLEKKTGEAIGFLSTHIIPKHRLDRISKIQKRKYRIVVSTQLVEAGVDIDFDVVYRDLAPLDSINQSAGRCNRHNLNKGTLYVVNLCNDKTNRPYARSVYDEIPLKVTESILEKYECIAEPHLLQLIEQYFDEVKLKSKSESELFTNSVKTLYFTGESDNRRIPISDFKLIEDSYEKIDVFVEVDERAAKIWEEFSEIIQCENALERYKKYTRLKKVFHEYVISVPANLDHLPPVFFDQICYVSNYSLIDFYDEKVGFKTKGEVAIW